MTAYALHMLWDFKNETGNVKHECDSPSTSNKLHVYFIIFLDAAPYMLHIFWNAVSYHYSRLLLYAFIDYYYHYCCLGPQVSILAHSPQYEAMEWCHCRWFFHAVTRHDTPTPESWSIDNEILADCFRASIVVTKPLLWSTQLWKSFRDWCFPRVMDMRVWQCPPTKERIFETPTTAWCSRSCMSAKLFSGAKKSLEGTILVFISDKFDFGGTRKPGQIWVLQ